MATASSPFMLQISGGLLVGMGLSGVSFALVLAALGSHSARKLPHVIFWNRNGGYFNGTIPISPIGT